MLGGDDFVSGRGGQPLVIPDVNELSIPYPPSSTFLNHP